jgi:hypothetical protein
MPERPSTPAPGRPGSPIGAPSAPPSAPTTGLPGGALDPDSSESWQLWWSLSRDPWLDVAAHVRSHDLAADGRTSPRGNVGARPAPAVVSGQIVPALEALLARDEPREVTAASLIALARIAEDLAPDERERALPTLARFLDANDVEVAEAALVALGVLGATGGMPMLAAVAADETSGRELLGRRVPTRRRAVAAQALALCARRADHEDARRYAVSVLARVLAADEQAELHAACVVGLGLVPPERDAARYAAGAPAERRGEPLAAADLGRLVDLLAGVMEDDRRPAVVRAQVPIALARLTGGGADDALRGRAIELLIAVLKPRAGEPRELERAAAIALGFLADADADAPDRAARGALEDYAVGSRDAYGARRAWIALARAATRPGGAVVDGVTPVDGAEDPAGETLRATRRKLLAALGRARGADEVWLALALGVLEREAALAGRERSDAAQSALRSLLANSRNAEESAALATAVGLGCDDAAGALCAKMLERTRATELRGALSLALGMTGDRAHADALIAVVADAAYRPVELSEAAIGLGLLGDGRAVEVLAEGLRGARSFAAQAAFATALGHVGDARAVAPLLAMLGDDARTDRARAFAAAALGRIADRDPLPWNTELKLGVNPTALPETLFDASGFGLLNLL